MAKEFEKRPPDFNLKVKQRNSERRGEVGRGWKNPDGSISIVLNPCVVISANDDVSIFLFTRDT